MKEKEYEQDRELMHRAIDGEVTAGEKEIFHRLISEDPAFREEFESLERAVQTLERGERIPAPAFFTAEVMKRLPQKKRSVFSRVSDFLFRGRTLRWNMAGALATVLIAVLAFAVWEGTRTGAGTTAKERQTTMVTLRLYAPDAGRVAVAGTFNKWKSDGDLLTRGENGYWTVSIPLEPGDYTYMFVVDGKAWITDPDAESYRDDGFGALNAVVRVRT